jgi:type IV pilus assembly protein PilB
VTVEDPVEYVLPGINQVHVNNRAGLTFASCLRSILRQDPNVIMVGEIRDKETAEIAMKASQTGHLVLSTLHTNDSLSAVTRLLDLGIPGFLIASSDRDPLSTAGAATLPMPPAGRGYAGAGGPPEEHWLFGGLFGGLFGRLFGRNRERERSRGLRGMRSNRIPRAHGNLRNCSL